MNTYAIIQEDKDPGLMLIALQLVSVLGAGVFLYTSRFYPIALLPAILLISVAIFLAGYSRHRLFSILLIGIFTALILSIRFDFLPWGDPWFEYEMVNRIIAYQTLNPSIYVAQFPILHVNIAAITLLSNFDPMNLQKFIIPSVSILAVYAVYKLTKDISSSETAFYAGLLLISGTPYLHWTTQGVRETVGLALFILTLYVCIRAIHSESKGYLLLSLLLISGVVLSHNLTMGIFFLVWLAISLTFLYIVCDIDKMRKTILFSLIITITSIVFMLEWWSAKGGWEFNQFNELMNTIFHSDFGIPLFLVCLIVIYLIPLVAPKNILSFRSLVMKILQRKDAIYCVFIIGAVIGSIVVMNYILGKSGYSLSYPLTMLFNGVSIMIFSLIGLYYFFKKEQLYVLVWIAVLSLALILSLNNIIQIEDRIRFIEFLYIPLSIIAAFGICRIAKTIGSPRIFPVLITVFVVVSIVTAFPSVVLFGQSFKSGSPLHDDRNLVIQHQPTEIFAVSWLDANRARGVVDTDAYVGYTAQGIIRTDALSIQSEYSFIRKWYPQYADTNTQLHYILTLSRMKEYTEFGIQWLKEKKPLDEGEIQKINNDCNLLYSNGNANVYLYFSKVTSENYFYCNRDNWCPPWA